MSFRKESSGLLTTKLQVGSAVLVITALLGTGIVYAAPQVKDSLQSWYQASFQRAVQGIEQNVIKNSDTRIRKAAEQVQAMQIEAAGSMFAKLQKSWIDRIESEQARRLGSYNRQMNEASDELIGTSQRPGKIQSKFSDYTDRVIKQTDESLELAADELMGSLIQQNSDSISN
jgi:hypothetical protein